MKRAFLLLLLSGGMALAQTINIPDANFKIRLLYADTTNSIAVNAFGSSIKIDTNNDNEIQVSEALQVYKLHVESSSINSLQGISSFTNLTELTCYNNNLSTLNVTALTQLTKFNCATNHLTTLDCSGLSNLVEFNCAANSITSLQVGNLTNLRIFYCQTNLMTQIDVSNLVGLEQFYISYNHLTSLDVSTLVNLQTFVCGGNNLTYLDVSNNPHLCLFSCVDSPLLSRLNMKDGSISCLFDKILYQNPNLRYVCGDPLEVDFLKNYFNNNSMPNVNVSEYCSFVPGGDYNTVTGTLAFDENNNGCGPEDMKVQNVKVHITDGNNSTYTFTDTNGSYNFYTIVGNYDVTAEVENPSYFNFSPAVGTSSFTDINNNISTQNFCISANGVHPDVEMVIEPVTAARPGFDAVYRLVYKNKGNQTVDTYLNLQYNDALTDYVSSSTPTTAATSGHLAWTILNVHPFECGYVEFTMRINAPTDTPPVNIGTILAYDSFIDVTADDNWLDNSFSFKQVVTNSFDPNDITCIEGGTVSSTEIGKYLHYTVRFENTGNAAAENVVVKFDINPAEFDISSLQLMNTSHEVRVQIKDNVIEFKFANINLAPRAGDPPVGGHGSILFKMKSQTSLNAGSIVTNKADIYFDYNFPIETNNAETTFATLNNTGLTKDESVIVYPNPANDFILVKADTNIKQIELFDIQGRILEMHKQNENAVKFNISNKPSGIYFLKITTEKGIKIEKLVKK